MLCGLAAIETGDICWKGVSVRTQVEAFRRELFYLGHLNALQESMTVSENIVFSAALGGLAVAQRDVLNYLCSLVLVAVVGRWFVISRKGKSGALPCFGWP